LTRFDYIINNKYELFSSHILKTEYPAGTELRACDSSPGDHKRSVAHLRMKERETQLMLFEGSRPHPLDRLPCPCHGVRTSEDTPAVPSFRIHCDWYGSICYVASFWHAMFLDKPLCFVHQLLIGLILLFYREYSTI
jgi:hypothetical protein